MTVAYDGTPFHGFAENEGVVTVGGALRRSIERVLGHPVTLGIAGRTDTGVHAWGQVVTFDADPARLDLEVLQRALNSLCRPSIAVRDLAIVEPDFHARFSATARVYRYRVYNESGPEPVRAGDELACARSRSIWPPCATPASRSWARTISPRSASAPGPCVLPTKEVSFVRAVRRAEWSRAGDGMLVFEIEARSFGRQMVRSIVGTLVDIGLGRRRASEVPAIIAARDRNDAGSVAPPARPHPLVGAILSRQAQCALFAVRPIGP